MNRKLTKSNNNIVLTGTLAGIAEYFNIDPTLVRIIYVILSMFTFGSPIVLYIILALIVPASNKPRQTRSPYEGYGHPYAESTKKGRAKRPRKEAQKVEDDDWSDF
ncbi:PspC family transcriptional regulator [Vagococcus martis]|uniref:PspC family transcriptional regulator n=1 Tax=Vagococcus martis TaxID=1768210 RepID=A0A1V4DES3_9ENTE|nr:PspC domain-containing protein [Vagococcus martis]OPF87002.1 PspC family transcriptional regulator [Vagococcus martis]